MKKIFFAIAICGLVFTSCGNKTNDKHPEGTHTHADGTVHEGHEHTDGDKQEHEHGADCDHDHDHDKPAQESFEVNSDTIKSKQ